MSNKESNHPIEAISAYIDGELDAAARGRVEAHLEACPSCRGLAEDLRAMDAAAASEEVPPVPAGLAARIASRAGPAPIHEVGRKPAVARPAWRMPLALAATVAALGILSIVWLTNPASRETSLMAPESDALRTVQDQRSKDQILEDEDAGNDVDGNRLSAPAPAADRILSLGSEGKMDDARDGFAMSEAVAEEDRAAAGRGSTTEALGAPARGQVEEQAEGPQAPLGKGSRARQLESSRPSVRVGEAAGDSRTDEAESGSDAGGLAGEEAKKPRAGSKQEVRQEPEAERFAPSPPQVEAEPPPAPPEAADKPASPQASRPQARELMKRTSAEADEDRKAGSPNEPAPSSAAQDRDEKEEKRAAATASAEPSQERLYVTPLGVKTEEQLQAEKEAEAKRRKEKGFLDDLEPLAWPLPEGNSMELVEEDLLLVVSESGEMIYRTDSYGCAFDLKEADQAPVGSQEAIGDPDESRMTTQVDRMATVSRLFQQARDLVREEPTPRTEHRQYLLIGSNQPRGLFLWLSGEQAGSTERSDRQREIDDSKRLHRYPIQAGGSISAELRALAEASRPLMAAQCGRPPDSK